MDHWKQQLKKRWEQSGIFHRQKAKKVSDCQFLKSLYTEQTLDVAQLADVFPLARIDANDVLSSRGISHDEARLRLADKRRQRRARRARAALRFLRQCTLSPFPMLLLCSSLICLAIALIDPPSTQTVLPMAFFQGVILALICITGAFERSRLCRLSNAFLRGGGQLHLVVREGVRMAIGEEDLLPGDLLWIEAGKRVPVDLRILWVHNEFRATTNWLTGRPEAMRFTARPAPRHAELFAVRNILFAEFACTGGTCLGLAVRTGKKTLYSRLLSLKTTFVSNSSPEGSFDGDKCLKQRRESALRQSYRAIVRSVVWLSFGISSGALLLSLLLSDFARPFHSFVHVFLLFLIASVPQALPLTLGAQLLVVARRLRRKCGGMLLRNAAVADALGRTSILMVHSFSVLSSKCPTVTEIWLAGQNKMINAAQLVREGKREGATTTALDELLQMAHLCTVMDTDRCCLNIAIGSDFEPHMPRKWEECCAKQGHTTDMALAQFLCQISPSSKSSAAGLFPTRKDEWAEHILQPFERLHPLLTLMAAKWDNSSESVPLARNRTVSSHRLVLRGPAEEVLKRCTTVAAGKGRNSEQIDEHNLAQFEDAFLALSTQAKSCIGFAVLDLSDDDANSLPPFLCDSLSDRSFSLGGSHSNGWSFLGMFALDNSIDGNCGANLAQLASAGVRFVLLSDQHPIVSEAIAEQLAFVANSERGDESVKVSVIQMPLELQLDDRGTIFGSMGLRKNDSFSSSSGYHSSERGDIENFRDKGNKMETVCDSSADFAKSMFIDGVRQHLVLSQFGVPRVLSLIKELQLQGHCVTFVGAHPLEDVSALCLADVGIAQNNGSPLLKEASDVLCANVQLDGLVRAIGEGRLVTANLASTMAFCLSFAVPALLPVLLSLLLPLSPGMTPLQTLVATLLVQIPPAVAMVFQRQIGPMEIQKTRTPIVPRGLLLYVCLLASPLIALGALVAYLSVLWHSVAIGAWTELSPSGVLNEVPTNLTIPFAAAVSPLAQQIQFIGQARAAWLLTLVLSQLFHAWICAGFLRRNWQSGKIFLNWPLWVAILLELFVLLLLVYVPGLHFCFGTEPPPHWIWLFPAGIALGLSAIITFLRLLIRFIRRRGNKTCANLLDSLFEWRNDRSISENDAL